MPPYTQITREGIKIWNGWRDKVWEFSRKPKGYNPIEISSNDNEKRLVTHNQNHIQWWGS
jgi:hypothetical protein